MKNTFYLNKALNEFGRLYRRGTVGAMYILLFTIMSIETAFSQSCGCDHVISTADMSGGVLVKDGDVMNVQPGDKVCIMAGTYNGRIELIDFEGTASSPVLIVNCGGQVVINTTSGSAFEIESSQYFKVSGRGDPAFGYGINITGSGVGAQGLHVHNLSTDFEVEGFEVSNTGFAGIMSKTDPNCSNRDRRSFVQRNSIFHDNYVHHTGGEGFYIGYTAYPEDPEVCSGTNTILYGHKMENVQIYNNLIEHTGYDGIQIGATTKDGAIFNNIIRNHGTKGIEPHGHGIQLSNDVICSVYNNKIIPATSGARSGYANGIASWGAVARIFNNLIVNAGTAAAGEKMAIQLYNTGNPFPDSSHYILNNTIINPIKAGISMFHQNDNNKINNNIIVSQTGYYIKDAPASSDTTFNYFTANITYPKFSDSDYHLSDDSPCIDNGVNRYADGVTFDHDNNPRPSSGPFDQGAYEFGAQDPGTKALKVNFRIITGPAPPTDWNDFTSFATNATLTNIKYSDGTVSDYDITVTNGFTGANNSGETSGIYPSAVMQTAWFVENTTVAELTLSGLDNNKKYTLKFFASRHDTSPQDRTTLYTIGGTTESLNASSNTSTTADFLEISPISGSIVVTVANAAGGTEFGYINAMEIFEVEEQAAEAELKLDFRPTAGPVGPSDWNSLTNIGLGATKALNYSNGESSGYSVEVTSGFSGVNSSGVSTTGVYPAPVMQTAWYVNGATVGQLTFSGLDNSKSYTFEFFGSRDDGGTPQDRNTEYDIGTTVETLNASNNSTLVATIADVTPTSGTIVVEVRNAPNGTTFGYLNAMRIIEGAGGGASAMMMQAESADNTFTVHPMPYTDHVTVTFKEQVEGTVAITVKDIHGRTHSYEELYNVGEGTSVKLDLATTNMPRGMGVIKVQSSSGYTRTIQIYRE